jgi:formylmethanofuran dehydrogenase subunit E
MKTFDEYVRMAEAAHGLICAGQILGVRLAICGLEHLGLDDPTGKHGKRLITYVEIDRCATDAIPVATGCRLGHWLAVRTGLKEMPGHKAGRVMYKQCCEGINFRREVRTGEKTSCKSFAGESYCRVV